MKLLIATPFCIPDEGVLGMYAHEIGRALRKEGHAVRIVSMGALRRFPPGVRHGVYFVRLLLHGARADIILALDTWSVGMPALLTSRILGKPLVVRIGGDYLWETYTERTREPLRLSDFYSTARALSRKETCIRFGALLLTRHAHALLFTTHFQRSIWERAYGTGKSVRVVENYFQHPARRTHFPREVRFVHVGRDIFLKNKERVRRAFERIAKKHPDITLDERTLPRDAHSVRVRQSYAVLIGSLSEVCSNTAIEAVSLGVPFIAPKDTGTSERLAACGLFVDTRSEDAIAKAIEEMLDPAVYGRLSAGIQSFSHEHSWGDIADEILVACSV